MKTHASKNHTITVLEQTSLFQNSLYVPRENFVSCLWFHLGKLYFPISHNLLMQQQNQIVFLGVTNNNSHFKQYKKRSLSFSSFSDLWLTPLSNSYLYIHLSCLCVIYFWQHHWTQYRVSQFSPWIIIKHLAEVKWYCLLIFL